MAITLYPHNQEAYESAVAMLAETGKAAIVHPTGTGKSFIGFKYCEDHPDRTVLWLSPSEYIFRTQLDNLRATGAEIPPNIRFCTYAKLMNMSEEEVAQLAPDACVWDEFHRGGAVRWQDGLKKLMRHYPDIPVLGLSATAIRYLDNRRDMVDELFDGHVAGEMTLGEAIVRGILNPPKYVLTVFSYQKDLERYRRRVQSARNKAVRDLAENYLEALRRALENADGLDVIFDKHMSDRTGKYIVFCASKEHMDRMMERSGEWFARVDPHPHIYSVYADDPSSSRSFDAFREDADNTHLRLLYCIDALNEGIHVENVSGVILLRPTISPIIYKQQVGRALSASRTKEPVIFDIVMNIENLYSIDSVKEEMRMAMLYYRHLGEKAQIVNENFRVLDEVRDCRELFERLNDTLTASWDVMYACARQYYADYGNLDVPKRYKTAEGYSLGHWVITQRRVYRGEVFGVLGEERIAKLNAIGMTWDSAADRAWKQNYAAAKAYYEQHGDLRVPTSYVTDTGIRLGNWIRNLRMYQKGRIRTLYLTEERARQLEQIGMVWDVSDANWERHYAAAVDYFKAHGNIDVPKDTVTKDGLRLGVWLDSMREARQGGADRLTPEQIERLNALGMVWERSYARKWETGYAAAKAYAAQNAHLDVPSRYRTDDGFRLGEWICDQREKYRAGKMKSERIERLEAIGMIWQREDPWEMRFELARQYYLEHGNLNMPADYTVRGICLRKWLSEQKQAYRGNRPQKLTPEQIRRLESIGMEWRNRGEVVWERRYRAVKAYYDACGNLSIPKDTVLTDGRSIGSWLAVQRMARKKGKLTDTQIALLDAVGMVWTLPDAWETGFEHAQAYWKEHGNLLVPAGFTCEDGFALGKWIANQRSRHNVPVRSRAISSKQVKRLEGIGMVWSAFDTQWNAVYEAAAKYFREQGHLNVPIRFRTEDGTDLWEWIRTQRNKYRKGLMSAECAQKLEEIGMDWLFPAEREWEKSYAKAKRFYLEHGHLEVPSGYRTEDGMNLSKWLERQRRDRAKLKTSGANGNQILRLTQIGMVWDEGNDIASPLQRRDLIVAV